VEVVLASKNSLTNPFKPTAQPWLLLRWCLVETTFASKVINHSACVCLCGGVCIPTSLSGNGSKGGGLTGALYE